MSTKQKHKEVRLTEQCIKWINRNIRIVDSYPPCPKRIVALKKYYLKKRLYNKIKEIYGVTESYE